MIEPVRDSAQPPLSDSESRYQIQISGERLLSGDEKSARMIFGNLTGINYARSKPADYFIWLGFMQATYPQELAVGRGISLVGPEGVELQKSTIGAQLMQGWEFRAKFDWKFILPDDGYEIRLHLEQRNGSPAWVVSQGQWMLSEDSVSSSLSEAYQKAQDLRAYLEQPNSSEDLLESTPASHSTPAN